MDQKDIMGKIPIYAFIAGIIIALICGLWQAVQVHDGKGFYSSSTGAYVAWVLVILGGLVGILALLGKGTVTKEEIPGFVTAGVAFLVMYAAFSYVTGPLGGSDVGMWLGSLLNGVSLSLALFIAPAVGLLSLKAVWDIGKDV
jgi:hypothetical protein